MLPQSGIFGVSDTKPLVGTIIVYLGKVQTMYHNVDNVDLQKICFDYRLDYSKFCNEVVNCLSPGTHTIVVDVHAFQKYCKGGDVMLYSHGDCAACHEQHSEEVLTEVEDGRYLCPTCFGEYEDETEGV